MSAVEQIRAEVGRLKGQRDEALARAEGFDRKLEGLNERRTALAPPPSPETRRPTHDPVGG